MPVSSVTEHWIKPDAVTINLNHFGDPDYLQVSVLAGAVVMAFKQDVIGYNAAHNYRTWPLQAANTYLETTSAYNVYARLTRSEVNASALIVYDPILRDIEGRPISQSEKGEEVLREADPTYFYVFLGQISESIGSSGQSTSREWIVDFRFGNLDTSQYRNEEAGGEWQKMFRLNKVTDMIDVLKTFSSAIFKRLFIGEKEIGNIQRSTDHLDIDDNVIPTTKYTEESYLSKKKDDHTPHSLSVGKNLSVGKKITAHDGLSTDDFLEGASGASVYQDEQGTWHIETDNLHVRRKLFANEVEIQTTNYIGGQTMLSAASMRIDSVEEMSDRYRCLFRKKNGDGDIIRQEWKLGDCAYCNTFNLEEQADGTIGNHYYWMEVVGVSADDWNDDFHYVELSKVIYAEGSSAPKAGDKVVHLGYNKDDDPERQSAIVIAGAGTGSPYIRIFQGIHNFTLPSDPEQLKPGDNRLSGRMSIKAGSTGWENLAGLPEKIQEAMNSAVDLEGLEYGKNNLLLNSGFTGDFVTASLSGESMLKGGSQMFSPSLKYWDVSDDVVVEVSEVSESGYEVSMIDDGYLEQVLLMKVVPGDNYIFSFRGKGGAIRFTFGDVYHQFDLDDDVWHTYSHKFQAPEGVSSLRVEAVADCNICELQLERGTVRSAWGMSPLDNRSELAKYESMSHIRNLLKQNGLLEAGVVNTGLITMGKVGDDGELTGNTAGISGQYNDDDSVAFWAGGDYEQALYAIATYLDNPNYTPTRDELSNMAKFVVTHGGRAILNDIVLRGYVYALGGYFKGEVNAEKGIFKNVQSPNGHFKINDDGTVEIVGKIETSVNGKKIVIDADTNAIILYDQIGRETAKIAFSEGLWATGFVSLKQFNGESNDVVAETTITPTYSIFQQNGYRTFFGFDGMSVMKENEDEILLKVGLNPYGSGVNIEGYEPIFMVNESIGITQDITIDAYYAKHKLVFKDGLLVGYTRTDNDN